MRLRPILAVLAVTALASTAATDVEPLFDGDDPHVRSASMSWVANLQYPVTEANTRTGRPDTQGGTDLELATVDGRDYAFSGSYENGFHVVDVTDPASPVQAGHLDCNAYQGDVQVWERDGRWFSTFAVDYDADPQSDCFRYLKDELGQRDTLGTVIIDVTDPTAPVPVSIAPTGSGSHNITVHPSGDFLYNSDNGTAQQLEVFDIRGERIHRPRVAFTLPLEQGSSDAHDVTFSADGTRAYVASITHTYILDTSDPLAPTVVSTIVDPAASIHHQADPITVTDPVTGLDRTFLIISDEVNGAGGNGYCPGGGLHVWETTGPLELRPVKVGAYFMPDVTIQEGAQTGAAGLVSCTAHVYRMYPEHRLMSIANMAGGVRVIDLSRLVGVSVGDDNTSTGEVAGMRDVGFFRFTTTHDTWAVKAHPDRVAGDGSMYLYSNDQTRGFDVFHFDASRGAEEVSEPGRWASPAEALERARLLDLRLGPDRLLAPFCTLRPDALGASG